MYLRPQKPSFWKQSLGPALALLLAGCTADRLPAMKDQRRTSGQSIVSPSLLVSTPDLPPLPTLWETEGPVVGPLRVIASEARRKRHAKAVGIALIDLGRGRAYGVNARRVFRPASVIKLAVMVAAFDAARAMPPAAFDRLRPDIRRMIIASDNPATRRLVLRLGKSRVNRTMTALGLPGLTLGDRSTGRLVLVSSRATAAETALLLARLTRREVVSRAASEEMLALLGDQQRRNRIPAGTLAAHARKGHPPDDGLWIGNKTGTLAGLIHDAALIHEPREGLAYALAVYTQGAPSESAGVQLCATIAARAYELLSAP